MAEFPPSFVYDAWVRFCLYKHIFTSLVLTSTYFGGLLVLGKGVSWPHGYFCSPVDC